METTSERYPIINRCGQCPFNVRKVCTVRNVFVSEYMRVCNTYIKLSKLSSAVESLTRRINTLKFAIVLWSINRDKTGGQVKKSIEI